MSSPNLTWCVPSCRSVRDLKPNLRRPQDEPFHVPQAQAYCNGEWATWDPKITTPPGLYISSHPRAPAILTYIPQIPVERHPKASHYLQMQLAYTTVDTAVDFAGTPVCSDAFALLP